LTETSARRSFIDHHLLGGGVANGKAASTLRLCDLNVLPRWGVKGRGALAWLRAAGANVPESDNRAQRQADGTLIARLSPGEALILPSLSGAAARFGAMLDELPPEGREGCYPAPRRDSHCWFALAGADASRFFAKLCAVDLSTERFADGSIAQTSVARLSAILIRHDLGGAAAFFVLAESASAQYLWDCLLDAMQEFSGRVIAAAEIGN
jgi:sarcosine oxidase subunit gamma